MIVNNNVIKKMELVLVFIFLLILASTYFFFQYPENFIYGSSFRLNLYWQDYFTEHLLSGDLYPRWLENYVDGIGAPVFYYYAPLPFYYMSFLTVLFGINDQGLVILLLAYWSVFALSALTFYIFIKVFLNAKWALIMSSIYMLLPYHYLDVMIRQAYGESFAYVFMPLILYFLSKNTISISRLIYAGIAYAALIFSHMPSAVLFAPVIFIFLFFLNNYKILTAVIQSLAVGIVGALLASIYLLPALILLDKLPKNAWLDVSGERYDPVNWLIGGSPIFDIFGVHVYALLGVITLGSFFLVIVHWFIVDKNSSVKKQDTSVKILQASIATIIFCWCMFTSFSSIIWENVSVLRQVQFPWRMGISVEISVAIIVSLTMPSVLKYFGSFIFNNLKYVKIFQAVLASMVILLLISANSFYSIHYNRWLPVDYVISKYIDNRAELEVDTLMPEYIVKAMRASVLFGDNTGLKDAIDLKQYINSQDIALVTRKMNNNEKFNFKIIKVGHSQINANLTENATIQIRRVFFPHWKLIDETGNEVALYPDDKSGLLRFDLPAGKHSLNLVYRTFFVEKVGMWISIASIILLLLLLVFKRKNP